MVKSGTHLKIMKQHARQIFQAAIDSVDPETAIREHVILVDDTLKIGAGVYNLTDYERIVLVGAGKASAPMAHAMENILQDRVAGGTIVTKDGHGMALKSTTVIEASHPVPDQRGVAGSEAVLTLAAAAGPKDLMICLISGGGSALMIAPAEGISLNDKQIAAIRPRMDPETGRVYSLKDIAVQHILSTNKWKLPMYLAVTVPDHLGLDDQLVMEGLVFRIAPEPVAVKVDTAKIRKNLYETFMYRGLLNEDRTFDHSVYKDANALKLVQNYAAAHARLAFELRRVGQLDAALDELEEARKFWPYGVGVKIALGALYAEAGRFDEAENHFRTMLEAFPDDHELHFRLGDVLLEKGQVEAAVEEFRRSITIKRDYFYPYGRLFAIYWQSGLKQEAVGMLRDWLRIRPNDDRIRAFYQAYRDSLQIQKGGGR